MEEKGEQGKQGRKIVFSKKVVLIIIAVMIIIGGGTGVGLLKASEKPAFCATCHNMKPYYASWKDSDLLANKHATAGVTCHECHQESIPAKINEGVKYVTGDYKTPLDKRDYGTRDFCVECHDFDEVKTKTNFEESNPHDSHNGEQDCNLCHNMHQQSKPMCSDCHIFGWMDDLDESWEK